MDNARSDTFESHDATSPTPSRGNPRLRRRLLAGLAATVLFVAGGYGAYWYTVARFVESTNDAYLAADNVTVASEVSGYIAALSAEENQPVRRGDILAKIDPRVFEAAVASAAADLKSAEANAANIEAQLGRQQHVINQSQAEVAGSRAAVDFARHELQRYDALLKSGSGTTQRLQQAQADATQRNAALQRDTAALDGAKAQVEVLKTQLAQAASAIERQKAALAQAEINLERTVLVSPIDGVVADRTVRQGQFVQPGARLMTVVPVDNLYLVANFKETQASHLTPGQTAHIVVDGFSSHPLNGRIESLAPGTGAQFALLPPENATGNFTKIVQRVPVKILLDKNDPIMPRLRPGLSVTVTVDTRK